MPPWTIPNGWQTAGGDLEPRRAPGPARGRGTRSRAAPPRPAVARSTAQPTAHQAAPTCVRRRSRQPVGFRVRWRSPPTRQATLQLLLERGQTYADLATLLGQDEAEVRARARAALTELGGADPDRNVGLTDYLLGQADPIGRADAFRHLREDPADHQLATELSRGAAGDVPGRRAAPASRRARAGGAAARAARPRRRRRRAGGRAQSPLGRALAIADAADRGRRRAPACCCSWSCSAIAGVFGGGDDDHRGRDRRTPDHRRGGRRGGPARRPAGRRRRRREGRGRVRPRDRRPAVRRRLDRGPRPGAERQDLRRLADAHRDRRATRSRRSRSRRTAASRTASRSPPRCSRSSPGCSSSTSRSPR